LAVGAIVALAMRAPDGAAQVKRWLLPSSACAALLVLVLVVVRPTAQFDDPGFETIGFTALDWSFAGLVFAAATSGSALLEWTPIRLAGRYSYGLYMYHPFVLWWIARHAPWLERSEWRSAAGAVVGSVAVAVVSYHVFEQQFLRLKARFAAGQPTHIFRHARAHLSGPRGDYSGPIGGPRGHGTVLRHPLRESVQPAPLGTGSPDGAG
jgi:peptidoglycan/LPS O-acetylase OafA/YrhL